MTPGQSGAGPLWGILSPLPTPSPWLLASYRFLWHFITSFYFTSFYLSVFCSRSVFRTPGSLCNSLDCLSILHALLLPACAYEFTLVTHSPLFTRRLFLWHALTVFQGNQLISFIPARRCHIVVSPNCWRESKHQHKKIFKKVYALCFLLRWQIASFCLINFKRLNKVNDCALENDCFKLLGSKW